MSKLKILKFLLMPLILSSFVFAQPQQTCQIAIPRYGVIMCQSTSSYEYPTVTFSCSGNSCTASFTCISNCQITSVNDIKVECDQLQAAVWKIYKNGELVTEKGVWGGGNFPITFDRGDTIRIEAQCTRILANYPVKPTSKVVIQQLLIMLYEGWAGTLPTSPISGTEGCSIQKIRDKYVSQPNVQSYMDPRTNSIRVKPDATYSSLDYVPTNWRVGETYVFVKDWETGIADISLTYDKQNNAYWCGGSFGNRKIYEVNYVTSPTGTCYAIPTRVLKDNLQCCFPSDCLALDPSGRLTCNPDTWRCEETKPCNSDIDCQQTFGYPTCLNKQITSWRCDTTKKWGSYSGTCVKQVRSVSQCPNECTANEYYNEDQGKCLPRITLLECPVGKCCEAGGNYKPRSCPNGLQCCHTGDPIIGECKQSCTEQRQETRQIGGWQTTTGNQPITGQFVLYNNPVVIVILILVIIASCIGCYFLFWKKGGVSLTKKVKPEEKIKTKNKVKYCTECGAKQDINNKYCTKCGNKLN